MKLPVFLLTLMSLFVGADVYYGGHSLSLYGDVCVLLIIFIIGIFLLVVLIKEPTS